jgi:beta-glucosidase
VHLEPGADLTVDFTVGPVQRRYWNAGVRDFVLDASTFDVWVGGDSTADLTTTFTTTA